MTLTKRGEWVHVGGYGERRPIFHQEKDRDWGGPAEHRLRIFSRCGLQIYDGGMSGYIYMPGDYAEKFARPCKRCYPA